MMIDVKNQLYTVSDKTILRRCIKDDMKNLFFFLKKMEQVQTKK